MSESLVARQASSNQLEHLADRVQRELKARHQIDAAICVVRGILDRAFDGAQPPTAPSDDVVEQLANALSQAENDRGIIAVQRAIENVRREAGINLLPGRSQDDDGSRRNSLKVPARLYRQARYYNRRHGGGHLVIF